jgi:hypothetical protein
MQEDSIHEIAVVKTRVYNTEFVWNKRTWPIDPEAIPWVDKKGVNHFFVSVNESDGIIRFMKPMKHNLLNGELCDKCGCPKPLNQCEKCGGKISYDAQSVKSLVNKNTHQKYWGVDNSHIMIILVLGIVLLIMGVAIMYMYGETQKLNAQIVKQVIDSSNTVTANFLLGVNIN